VAIGSITFRVIVAMAGFATMADLYVATALQSSETFRVIVALPDSAAIANLFVLRLIYRENPEGSSSYLQVFSSPAERDFPFGESNVII